MKRYLPFIIIASVATAAATGGTFLYRAKRVDLSVIVADVAGAKPGAKPPHSRGENRAPVTLEEFGDFQCPPCQNIATGLLKLEHDYGTKLRVIFRQFPLAIHNHADLAARAAEAAGRQDRFWEMHDLIYRNQLTWSQAADVEPIFAEYAKEVGLNVDRYKRDLVSEEVKERVHADQERGESLGVKSTPSVFINGHMVAPVSLNEPGVRRLIDDAIAGKTPTPTPTISPAP
ncbi:MAG: DsbA family protein [Chthoniobacterales bacterium]